MPEQNLSSMQEFFIQKKHTQENLIQEKRSGFVRPFNGSQVNGSQVNGSQVNGSQEADKIRRLSDESLLTQIDTLVRAETKLTTEILRHLKEIDARKLYANKNCDSLFTYCTRILRYSEAQAHRRITAARLLDVIPELEQKIVDGRLTLTNIAQAQNFFNFERRAGRAPTPERKNEILAKIEAKSSREAERILIAEHPSDRPLKRESMRFISESIIELKLIITPDLLQKLTRVKVLSGHKLPEGNWVDIISMMCDDVLDRKDPLERARRAEEREKKKALAGNSMVISVANSVSPAPTALTYGSSTATSSTVVAPTSALSTSKMDAPPIVRRDAIPAHTRHQVWLRDDGRCSHRDSKSAIRCNSNLRLEIDHIRPVALGGSNSFENLRLLCRAHNQRRSIEAGWKAPTATLKTMVTTKVTAAATSQRTGGDPIHAPVERPTASTAQTFNLESSKPP